MPHQQLIYGRKYSKNKINKYTGTSIAISFRPLSNKTPPSPPYHVGSEIKAVSEAKYDE